MPSSPFLQRLKAPSCQIHCKEGSLINAWDPKKKLQKKLKFTLYKSPTCILKAMPKEGSTTTLEGSALQKGWMCCKSYTTDNASVGILKTSWTTRNEIKFVRKLQWFDRLSYWDWQWTSCILREHAILIHKFIEAKPQYNAVIFLMSRVLTFTCHFYGQKPLIFFSGLFFSCRSFIKTHWLYRQGAREGAEEPVRAVGEGKAGQLKCLPEYLLPFHCTVTHTPFWPVAYTTNM